MQMDHLLGKEIEDDIQDLIDLTGNGGFYYNGWKMSNKMIVKIQKEPNYKPKRIERII